jgi:hypothetical protein
MHEYRLIEPQVEDNQELRYVVPVSMTVLSVFDTNGLGVGLPVLFGRTQTGFQLQCQPYSQIRALCVALDG